MPLCPGLTSITHRELTPSAIIALASEALLTGIEWAADVHVRPGRPDDARNLAAFSAAHGLRCLSYGTYFRPGEDDSAEFEPIMASAIALGARQVRVWAGRTSSRAAGRDSFDALVRATRVIAGLAAAHNLGVAFEFHDGTLNDTAAASRRLIEAIDRANVRTYWQPPVALDDDAALDQLEELVDLVTTVHVFSWDQTGRRLALAEREALWRPVLSCLQTTGREHAVLLEHVKDDDPRALLRDAATLVGWCDQVAGTGADR